MLLALMLGSLVVISLAGCGGDRQPENRDSRVDSPAEATNSAEHCLRDAGFQVRVGKRDSRDLDAPEYEIVARRGKTNAFVGVFEGEDSALSRLQEIEQNAERYDGFVEHRGAVVIAWTKPPSKTRRYDLNSCLP